MDTDQETRKRLGNRIAEAREAAGLNPAELSREIGVSRAAVAQWEVGKTEPNARNLRKIASVVGVTLEWLGQGRGTAAAAAVGGANSGSIMSEGELIDLKALDASHAEMLKAATKGKKAEVWRLTSDALAGAGYQPGDFLIVDVGATAHARDMVLATFNKLPVFRLLFPPWLYVVQVGKPAPAPIVVDNLQTIVRGVVISRLTLT
jgi:transcriptional regulator with XRE-family HTH domain